MKRLCPSDIVNESSPPIPPGLRSLESPPRGKPWGRVSYPAPLRTPQATLHMECGHMPRNTGATVWSHTIPWSLSYPTEGFKNIDSRVLIYWGRVKHKCVNKLDIIGSDNGLSPVRRQAIIWTNAGLLLIGTLRTKVLWNLNKYCCIWNCCLQNGGHFVSASTCQLSDCLYTSRNLHPQWQPNPAPKCIRNRCF